jgi:hypothetical protein
MFVMKHWARVAVVMLAGLFAAMGMQARPGGAGSGGGHGGHGGHGRFSSGHSSGPSLGSGIGHAIGRSLGHLFGRHSKAASSTKGMAPPLAGAGVLHGNVVQLPGLQMVFSPARRTFHRRPINDFPFDDRLLFFPPRPGFEFGGCTGFGFPRYPFLFDDGFNCFSGGLFFDPLFIGGFSGSFISGPALVPFNTQRFDYVPDDSEVAPAEARPAQPSDSADLSESGGTQNAATNGAASDDKAKSEQPVILLQLRDGSMYGLEDYWVEDGQLHYTTTYGGQDSIGLDRIDLEKTVQLNAERGIQFVLRPKAPPR